MARAGACQDRIVLGKVSGVYGVRGWVRIYSYTRPTHNIFTYQPWTLLQGDRDSTAEVAQERVQGKALVARITGYSDREAAAALVGAEISIGTDQLPLLAEGEYYWAELINMTVVDTAGTLLGKIEEIRETAANDVLVVTGEERILIPWVKDIYIRGVNRQTGTVTVDWDGEV